MAEVKKLTMVFREGGRHVVEAGKDKARPVSKSDEKPEAKADEKEGGK